MSLAAPRSAATQRPQQYQKTLSAASHASTPTSTYHDEAYLDRFYDLDDEEDGSAVMMEDPIQTKTAIAAAVVVPVPVDGNTTTGPPSIPQKHNLRASRLLDAMTLGKLGAMLEPGMTTPHDVYLSSEEDASSSADDFSDYDYESASEEFSEDQHSLSTPESPAAPSRRRSHEVTARVVSVVFSGKPSVIELPRRIGTPGSSRASDSDLAAARKRQDSITSSEQAHEDILAMIPARVPEAALPEATSRDSPHNSLASRTSRRRSSVFSALLHGGKPKPPFLNIDPFANGSTYSLELPKEESTESTEKHHHHIPYYPKNPTALFKKTLGTIRRRSSRQALQAAVDSPPPPSRSSTTPVTAPSSATSSPVQQQRQQRPSLRPISFYSSSSSTGESMLSETSTIGTPSSPVTYNDIIRAAKRNAKAPPPMMAPLEMNLMAMPPMPESPTTQKKGIMKLRRRSQKIVNGRLV